MSPSKLGRKLSFIKAITIDKLSPSKGKHKVLAVESSTTPSRQSIQHEPFVIISPKQKEKLRRLAQSPSNTTQENVASISNETPSLSRSPENPIPPVRRKLSLEENGTPFDDSLPNLPNSLSNGHEDSQLASKLSPENEQSCSLTGARPKPRKKRAPPPPPQKSSIHTPMDMDSNSSSTEEGERSVSPDDSITHILEQDALVHSDSEHNDENNKTKPNP